MRRVLGVAFVVGLAGVAAVIGSREGRDPAAPSAGRATEHARVEPVVPLTTGDPPGDQPAKPRAGRPRSLRGTRTDGGLLVDADGRFVPTLEARRLFDYFLTTEGELEPGALRARIVREIKRRLPPDAARHAIALLDRYLAYREAVRQRALESPQDGDDVENRIAMLGTLRRDFLGEAAATSFFGEEETEARLLLETRRILGDRTLSPEGRTARVEALYAAREASLPAEVRDARATARLAAMLPAVEAEVRSQGGDAAQVHALRERLAGPEAAARLADLDRRRAEWDVRVQTFRAARTRLQQDTTLSPDARAAAIAGLLDKSFTAPERQRVATLDSLAAAGPGSPPGR